ncbi:hypothetical protein SAMD00019534_007900 [Acytostelium subglobosum LB1]|uniref:hypothetical protein n=1 Tax=Acytostelium subglobosum LB1 TaxID=1410327 RepID=UPI000644A74B|nr:hypothetical protein SAMD00019534_007900 [Acytostelium subglobosum LB1]GAM17615.1 hypothetical protein SAMD00019534_007900 [Acytostelium subglobosum LB1]|eukprot:XP_012758211.1 hypothetical protein SAMD00019534_007900 [Acytostelium subglobosum LB1]
MFKPTLLLIILVQLILFSTFSIKEVQSEPVALGACGSGSATPTLQLPKGQCGLPLPSGFSPASVSMGFFSNGTRCGECYRVIGPRSSIVVMIIDVCNQGAACYQNDRAHFILLNNDFYKIASTNESAEIYSLGYQQVSCEHPGNINISFAGGGEGYTDFAYYFRVMLSFYTVGIKTVQVQGTGMAGFQVMKYENGGFTWNKLDESTKFIFPGTLLITAQDNEAVTYTFNNVTPYTEYDTHKQFTPSAQVSNQTDCEMGMVQQYIYDDHVLYGWESFNSFNFSQYTVFDTQSPFSGESDIKMDLNPHGGLTFSRDGGFTTRYLKTISFAAKASQAASLRVFFGSFGAFVLPSKLTTNWQKFYVPIGSLEPRPIEYMISFYNNQDKGLTFYFDDFQWEFTDDVPLIPPVNLGTTTFNPTTTDEPVDSHELPTTLNSLFPTTGGDSTTWGTGSVSEASASSDILVGTTTKGTITRKYPVTGPSSDSVRINVSFHTILLLLLLLLISSILI